MMDCWQQSRPHSHLAGFNNCHHEGNPVKTQAPSNRPANRLAEETSTYLLQHAHNPVDWYPWGEEALARAKAEDKPILLSVGYSACHWCHVMEHESFEDEHTAASMNDLFICIKVDREERPDIDEIYMKAVQMLTGHGGWPMTVFLTPDLKPFFAGTYFPPQDKHGIPSFSRVLTSVASAWNEQRDSVESSASEITKHLAVFEKVPETRTELHQRVIERSVDTLYRAFDKDFGGLGGAPKFPHPSALSLIMQHCVENSTWQYAGWKNCHEMLVKTLDEMACGGIYDQLGGGFARYSVDRQWLIPHFEKMLYDNAQLCRNYLQGYQLTGRPFWAQIGRETLEFVLREMTTAGGAFYSSLDADSEGVEGKFYAWTPAEITAVLGATDGEWLCAIYGVINSGPGNFEHGTSVLHLMDTPDGLAKARNMTTEELWKRLNPLRERLLQAREKRIRPGRDEKVLLSWNGLMISAFVDGYRILGEPTYLAVARRAADFVLASMMRNDRLLRTWGRGQAKLPGYLDDYTYFIQALLDLASVDFDTKWLEMAMKLNQVVLDQFTDSNDGSFFYSSKEHERLIARTKTFYDAAIPSPSAVAAMNLLRLGTIFDRQDLKERAEKLLDIYAPFFEKIPDQFSSFLLALEAYLVPAAEIVFVADADGDGWQAMLQAINSRFIPNAVVLLKDASNGNGGINKDSPLLKDRTLIDGNAAVYLCRSYTCEKPITDAAQLQSAIDAIGLRA
jgi:uncharacterized protein